MRFLTVPHKGWTPKPLKDLTVSDSQDSRAQASNPMSELRRRSMKRTPLEPSDQPIKRSPLKKASKKKRTISTAVLDRLFSDYIRRFENCELHGVGGIHCSSQLQCSHIKSRRFLSTRWMPENAICACAKHHRWQHDHPVDNARALEELFGRERLDFIHDAWLKGEKVDREAIYARLKAGLQGYAA